MSGWRQAPTCPHLGLISAVYSLAFHPEGHEWECTCGQIFRVVIVNGQKQLRKQP